mmetsp:Transcript_52230/g.96205  ORF Transcript_52230/g.96205 Transcript_52230/m.96205 type:complete len:206 (-) Transcript_52230:483-1100(-)
MRRTIGAQLKLGLLTLRTTRNQAVRNNPELDIWQEAIRAFLHYLDFVFINNIWKPLLYLLLPHPSQAGWANDKHGPLLSVLCHQSQRLYAFAQTHLIADEAAASAAEAEADTCLLVSHEPLWKPLGASLHADASASLFQHLQYPAWHALDVANLLKTSSDSLMPLQGEDPRASVISDHGALHLGNRVEDVRRHISRLLLENLALC